MKRFCSQKCVVTQWSHEILYMGVARISGRTQTRGGDCGGDEGGMSPQYSDRVDDMLHVPPPKLTSQCMSLTCSSFRYSHSIIICKSSSKNAAELTFLSSKIEKIFLERGHPLTLPHPTPSAPSAPRSSDHQTIPALFFFPLRALGQANPVGAKSPIFSQYSLVSASAVAPSKKFNLVLLLVILVGSPLRTFQ